MSNTADLLNFEIYPALYSNIVQALPEFDFKQTRGGYVSTTDHKITGDTGKRGKVFIYADHPTYLKDYTRGAVTIWDYIQKRDNLTNGETLKKLAELSGVILPPMDPEDQERIRKTVTQANIWEDANGYFIYCLNNSKGGTAQELKNYLQERGYTPEDVEKMELGYIPSQEQLYKYLTETKKHPKEAVGDAISLIPGIGTTHTLTIPYRDPIGRIKGIIVRAINPDVDPKYYYSTGLKKDEYLFNLRAVKGDRDLVIVEGILDSLIATARGMDNVVALGGTSINKTQIDNALRYGAKKFTLCLDNDKAGAEATLRALDLLQDQERVYIAQLPDGIKDPDQAIKERGADLLRDAINKALPYWKYRLLGIFKKYLEIADRQDHLLNDKEIDGLKEEVIKTSQTIPSPVDRDQYVKFFTSKSWIKDLGITPEALQDTVETLRYKSDVEKQGKELKKLQAQAKDLQDKGDITGAIGKLEKGLKDLQLQTAKELLPVYNFEDWEREIAITSLGLKTGIRALDGIITIPQGAITLIAGRPSHGKTTLLFNLLLSMAQRYGDRKKFYFFTYEEPKKFILVKILNNLIGTDLRETDHRYDNAITNLDYLKNYLREHRTDRAEIEQGRALLKSLLDSGKITVVDKSYSVEELGTVIRYLHRKEEIGAIFVDYIQRMNTKKNTQDKRTEIAHISAQMLQTAKDTGLPIILGAQLNRGAGGNPTLENLKEAGNLEEDANLVLSVYNESRENKEKPDGGAYGRVVDLKITALKNRDGEPNTFTLLDFDRWTLQITSPEKGSNFFNK